MSSAIDHYNDFARGLGRYVALDVYVPVISRCEDLGMCFELYGILASDEHSEDRISVMTTFFESLDAEVERINVADLCEHRENSPPSTRLVATPPATSFPTRC